MTFEGVKELLVDIKNAKQRALNIQARISSFSDMRYSLQSTDYSKPRVQGGKRFNMQSIINRVEYEVKNLAEALEMAFELEDKVAAAVALLTPTEQDIIIGHYIDCKFHWQLAQEMNYSERQIRNLRDRALRKMSENL